MGDPHSYITPDVVADFTTIQLEQAGENRVRVFGIKGRPATDKLKVSIAYRAGYKAVGTLVVLVARRARRRRSSPIACCASDSTTSGLQLRSQCSPSSSACRRRMARSPASPGDPPEVQLRVGVRGSDKASVERFTREIAPLVLNGPPSVTGFAGGRPKVEEIVAYWPALIDKTVVQTSVEVLS